MAATKTRTKKAVQPHLGASDILILRFHANLWEMNFSAGEEKTAREMGQMFASKGRSCSLIAYHAAEPLSVKVKGRRRCGVSGETLAVYS